MIHVAKFYLLSFFVLLLNRSKAFLSGVYFCIFITYSAAGLCFSISVAGVARCNFFSEEGGQEYRICCTIFFKDRHILTAIASVLILTCLRIFLIPRNTFPWSDAKTLGSHGFDVPLLGRSVVARTLNPNCIYFVTTAKCWPVGSYVECGGAERDWQLHQGSRFGFKPLLVPIATTSMGDCWLEDRKVTYQSLKFSIHLVLQQLNKISSLYQIFLFGQVYLTRRFKTEEDYFQKQFKVNSVMMK